MQEVAFYEQERSRNPGPQAANPTPSTNHKALAGKPAGATPVLYGVTGVLLIPWKEETVKDRSCLRNNMLRPAQLNHPELKCHGYRDERLRACPVDAMDAMVYSLLIDFLDRQKRFE